MKIRRLYVLVFACLMMFATTSKATEYSEAINLKKIGNITNSMAYVNLASGISWTILDSSDRWAMEGLMAMGGLSVGNSIFLAGSNLDLVFLRTAITLPIAYNRINKHPFYKSTDALKKYNMLSKMFFAFSIVNYSLNVVNIWMPWIVYSVDPQSEFHVDYKLVWVFLSPILAATGTIHNFLALFFLTKEIRIMETMEQNRANANNQLEERKRTVMISPMASPFIDRNRKISGGTAGLSLVF